MIIDDDDNNNKQMEFTWMEIEACVRKSVLGKFALHRLTPIIIQFGLSNFLPNKMQNTLRC